MLGQEAVCKCNSIKASCVYPLLDQFLQVVELIHPEMSGVKKADIRAQMGKKFKVSEDRISVFGVKPRYGGGRSSGFVSIYDDLDARKKYDTKC